MQFEVIPFLRARQSNHRSGGVVCICGGSFLQPQPYNFSQHAFSQHTFGLSSMRQSPATRENKYPTSSQSKHTNMYACTAARSSIRRRHRKPRLLLLRPDTALRQSPEYQRNTASLQRDLPCWHIVDVAIHTSPHVAIYTAARVPPVLVPIPPYKVAFHRAYEPERIRVAVQGHWKVGDGVKC